MTVTCLSPLSSNSSSLMSPLSSVREPPDSGWCYYFQFSHCKTFPLNVSISCSCNVSRLLDHRVLQHLIKEDPLRPLVVSVHHLLLEELLSPLSSLLSLLASTSKININFHQKKFSFRYFKMRVKLCGGWVV